MKTTFTQHLIFSIFLLASVIVNSHGIAQNFTLAFDGIDDKVNLGKTVGNGVRTIEFWMKPAVRLDSSLPKHELLFTETMVLKVENLGFL